MHLVNLKELSYFWYLKMVHLGFRQLKVSHLPGMMHSLSLLTLGEEYLSTSSTWHTGPLSKAVLLSLGLVHGDSGWPVVLKFTQSWFSEHLGFFVVILWCLKSGLRNRLRFICIQFNRECPKDQPPCEVVQERGLNNVCDNNRGLRGVLQLSCVNPPFQGKWRGL